MVTLPASPYLLDHRFAIRPHPLAPYFNDPERAKGTYKQLVSEIQSTRGNVSKEAYDLLRQLGFVSLFFFEKFILGHSGPYEKLDYELDLDMANFRQSDAWEEPGAKAAAFIPRGFRKSTHFTHGGDTWDLIRDPDERILIANAVDGKALEFLHQLQRNFDRNELLAYLYPEYVTKGGKINDKEIILPNRTRNYVEPSARAIGMTGAAEGGHYSCISIDDLIGLDSLNQERSASVMMETAKRWMNTNLSALRVDATSRIGLAATRYALDDCYEQVYQSVKAVVGWTKGDLQPTAGGEWTVYYRLVVEDGRYLRPDVMDAEGLASLLKKDYWAAMTQYFNSPAQSGLTEFNNESPRFAKLVWDEADGQYWLRKVRDENWDEDDEHTKELRLGACDVVMSTDFAATDSGVTSKTNRTSIAVWARDSQGNSYRIWSRVGFFSVYQTLDYIFEGHQVFGGVIRATFIEVNAFQKIMKTILETEQTIRGVWINPVPVNVSGDKFARIRSALGPRLTRGQIWVTMEAGVEFLEELKMFPMNKSRVDVLDESEKALTYLSDPVSDEERASMADAEERARYAGSLNAVGY